MTVTVLLSVQEWIDIGLVLITINFQGSEAISVTEKEARRHCYIMMHD